MKKFEIKPAVDDQHGEYWPAGWEVFYIAVGTQKK